MFVEDDTEECQLHQFKVVSRNDAGDSQPKVITDTLPISESAPLAVSYFSCHKLLLRPRQTMQGVTISHLVCTTYAWI